MAASSALRVVGSHLKEIRVHLCQRSPGSQGVRDFIEKHYVTLKKANPDFPILIRECSDVQPKLWARYDPGAIVTASEPRQEMYVLLQDSIDDLYKTEFGRETSISLNNLNVDQVAKALETVIHSKV